MPAVADTPAAAARRDNQSDRIAVAFARVLRGAGLAVPTGSVLTFVEALAALGCDDRNRVYWAGRATLVHAPEDIALYDRAFAAFWTSMDDPVAVRPEEEPLRVTLAVDDDSDDGEEGGGDADHNPSVTLRFSSVEVLRDKDFADYTDDELQLAQTLMSRLRLAGPPRRSLRLRSAPRGRRPDLAATVRASLRTGGEPVRRSWRRPGERMRRLVLLVDVSGSMEPYARAMLRFVHAAVAGRQRVEAFALGTRLTRMTKELSSRDPDEALRRASSQVHDWSGGTRLGECLRRFNDEWGIRGMARGAIVVVMSDGWDRGDPAVLGEQMERLQRVCHRLVWVNPLKVSPGYAPLARGMAAALPHVDDFVEGHSLTAMYELAAVIAAEARR
ncbi:MAG: vWA domain-containing protein [Ilumatobacteraceae bacterium]